MPDSTVTGLYADTRLISGPWVCRW